VRYCTFKKAVNSQQENKTLTIHVHITVNQRLYIDTICTRYYACRCVVIVNINTVCLMQSVSQF